MNLSIVRYFKQPERAPFRAALFAKCRRYDRHRVLADANLYPYFHALQSAQTAEVSHNGRRMIMLSSNNYLGLSTHPRVIQAAADAVHRFGTGCSGSRFLNGTLSIHEELEQKLARFLGRPSAIVFPTGFQANLGAISALTGKGDLVAIDKMDHASIYDGCRLSFAQFRKFAHNDAEDLDQLLTRNKQSSSLIVVDGVFSMQGDIADLPAIVSVARKHGAGILVDDAHALGVLGRHGRGTSEHFGLEHRVDLVAGTFSKSLASIGGFIAGDTDIIDYVKHHSRPLIFSASLPPASVAAASAALDVLVSEPEHRERLWSNTRYFREGLEALGFDVGPTETPIISLLVGDEKRALVAWRKLFDRGLFTSPILPPAVPPKLALVRTSCMASHTPAQLERALDALESVGKELGLC